MNLHKEITRRKLAIVMVFASVLLMAACLVAGRQRAMINTRSVPVTGHISSSDSLMHPEVSDTHVSVSDTMSSQTTAQPQQSTPASSAPTKAEPTTAAPPPPPAHYPADWTQRAECAGRFTVTSESANVRSDADRDAPLVRQIYAGESYEVIAQKPSTGGILWLELRFGDGSTGYVSASYGQYDGKVVNGKVYLTFDDGPSANTVRILDTLDKYGVKATFFVIYHSGQEKLYKDIVDRGHVIAMHSYTHSYSRIYSSSEAFFGDIQNLSDHVYDLTGERSNILRFPGGSSNTISQKYCPGIMTELTRTAAERGYTYYDWDVDSGDADENTVPKERIISNIKERMGNRRDAIVLLHDASAKTTTADALPEIIEYLQAKGYQILPITADTHQSHQRVYN